MDHQAGFQNDGLYHHPSLELINMVVDPDLRALCCNICQVALAPDQVPAHLLDKHKGISVNEKRLEEMLNELEVEVMDALPEPLLSMQGVPPFKGLKVWDGFACQICPQVYQHQQSLHDHHMAKHEKPCPTSWPACKMQQLNHGGAHLRTMWRVHDHPSMTSTSNDMTDIFGALREELDQDVTEESRMVDERTVSLWLRTTKWHTHVAGYDVKMLCKLVEMPGREDDDPHAPGIKGVVREYFEQATTLLEQTDELVLQRLNSPDPLKW